MAGPPPDDESNDALVSQHPPRLTISESLNRSQPGELMLIDDQGQVASPSQRARLQAQGLITLGTLAAVMAAYGWMFTHTLWPALLGPGLLAALVAWSARHGRAQRHLAALVAARRDEEAWVALEALERARLPALQRLSLLNQRGYVAWRLGKYEEALAALTAAVESGRKSSNRWHRTTYFLAQFQRAQLLCVLGRVDEARALVPELDKAPTGDYFRLGRIRVALHIAFAAGSTANLTDDLYDWSRTILQTSRFGSAAALLAWAFAARGDEEMARHMLAEAGPRMEGEPLERTIPALHAWYTAQCTKWGIDPDLA